MEGTKVVEFSQELKLFFPHKGWAVFDVVEDNIAVVVMEVDLAVGISAFVACGVGEVHVLPYLFFFQIVDSSK